MAEAKPDTSNPPPVNVQIDGEWHQFPKGTRMIEACRMAGKDVPHYCYHPKLTSPGNCRMCLVEMGMPPRVAPGQDPPERDEGGHLPIQWMPRPAIACANTVADGMGIRTDSTLTHECRNGVMEFLLANHPLDCPICDQAGECRLQEFSVEHGRGESRFREEKVHKPKNVDIGPRIRLDDERCIMCSRCIRFCEEIVDDPVLGFTDRGSHTTLTVHPGKELANNYSLNTADICPVGALTSNDFRFAMRVWFLKETPTIDVNCGTGCNILVHTRENRVYRITPRENNAVNSCWIPDSHRLNFHYLDGPDRLVDPLVKDGPRHRPVAWSQAFQTLSEGLLDLGGAQIGILASARMTNEELFLVRRLARQLGVEQIDVLPRPQQGDGYLISSDGNSNTEGAKLILGLNEPGAALPGMVEATRRGELKALLAFGEDAMDAGWTGEDLRKLSFFGVMHLLAHAASAEAQVVLPSAGWVEKRGSMINVTGRLQRLNQATFPPGNARDDWEILKSITESLTGTNGISMLEEVFSLMAKDVPAFEGLSLGKIGDGGIQLFDTGVKIPLLEQEAERKAKGLIVG